MLDDTMDIMLKAEFKIDIPGIAHGFGRAADATTSNFIVDNFRDIYEVESAMKWIKQVLGSKRISEPMITFSTYWNYASRGYGRVFRKEEGGYRIIWWNDCGYVTDDKSYDKYPAAEIRKLYLMVADACIEKNREIAASA